MAKVKDLKLENNDLVIANGDLVIAESDQQHSQDIINSSVGHYKEFPLVGVGIDYYRNSTGKEQELQRSIKLQLESDGYRVNEIFVKSVDEIYLDAERI